MMQVVKVFCLKIIYNMYIHFKYMCMLPYNLRFVFSSYVTIFYVEKYCELRIRHLCTLFPICQYAVDALNQNVAKSTVIQ